MITFLGGKVSFIYLFILQLVTFYGMILNIISYKIDRHKPFIIEIFSFVEEKGCNFPTF